MERAGTWLPAKGSPSRLIEHGLAHLGLRPHPRLSMSNDVSRPTSPSASGCVAGRPPHYGPRGLSPAAQALGDGLSEH
jgi:hypothetical protein